MFKNEFFVFFCILFSVVFTSVSSSHHGSVWLLPDISLLCIAGAGLPIYMIGEVSWEP
jgi:hypothetical protein